MYLRLALLAGLCLASATLAPLAASAAPVSPNLAPAASANPSIVPITHYGWWWGDRGWHRERRYHYSGYGRYCERLRRACVYKYERGEVGEGNCRRYRHECGRRHY